MKTKSYKLKKLEKNRTSILTDDLDYCYLCGMPRDALHEVYFGNNRRNSMLYGCVIPVCIRCHALIHSNNEYDKQLKKIMQEKFEEVYMNVDFIEVFHHNYKD